MLDRGADSGRYSPSEALSVPRLMRPKRRISRWDRVILLWSIWGQRRFGDFGSSEWLGARAAALPVIDHGWQRPNAG